MPAQQFESELLREPCRPDQARSRPSSAFLILKEFLRQNPSAAEPWDESTEERFRQFRVAPEQQAAFAYMPTGIKRMIAAAIAQRVAAKIPVPKELQTMHRVSVEECLAWRNVPSVTSKNLLPAFRKKVKETYGVRLTGEGPDWSWTVKVGSVECSTMITFGGPYCQFTYTRGAKFPDSPQGRSAMSREECIGEFPPHWDLMTGDTMAADLDLFFTFGREMDDRIRHFASSVV